MRIAVDAMGGDLAPNAPVRAAWEFARQRPEVTLTVIGDADQIRKVAPGAPPDNVEIVHTSEAIGAGEEPVRAVRRKSGASMVLAARQVREGRADAMLSAGNTGALVASGLLVIGRIEGIERPALAPILPTFNGHGVLLLDAGATVDADSTNLLQFAHMGTIYSRDVLGIDRPRVGLLNIGTEEGKGNALCKATYPLLAASGLEFVGNLEARDLLEGSCDVVVCDGFVGNVALKLVEGVGLGLFGAIKDAFMQSTVTRLAALLAKRSLRAFRERFDYAEYGGAPLLGVAGGCIKAHGSSNERAWFRALEQAARFVEQDVLTRITQALEGSREQASPTK